MTCIKAALIVQHCMAGQFQKNKKQAVELTCQAAEKGAKFIVFPEMNLTGYVAGKQVLSIAKPLDTDLIECFSDLAQKTGTTILTGLAQLADQNRLFAVHLVFFPDGTHDSYRKIHTAPFEQDFFCAGNQIKIFKSHGIHFGVQLCYDAHFPELSLAMALRGADIIFIPHASPRGTSQQKYESWIRHLRARAFDNGIFIAACNQVGDNSKGLYFPGISLFIGPDGHVIHQSEDSQKEIHIVDIDLGYLDQIRSHKMKYFLPNRRSDLFDI